MGHVVSKMALFGLKNDEKCLFTMLFFVLGSRLSDTKFFDSDPFGGDIASQGDLRWPKRDAGR